MHCTMRTATRTRQDKVKNNGFKLKQTNYWAAGSLTPLSPYRRRHRMPSEFRSLPPRAIPSKRSERPRATPPPPLPFSCHCPDALRAAPARRIRARRPQRVRRPRRRGWCGGASWGGRPRGGRGRRGICRDGRARCAHGARVGGGACGASLRICVRGTRAHVGGALLLLRRRRTTVGTG